MSTMSEIMNTIAQIIVILSRFFSMMLVPVWVEYIELAMASEIPVPLPECMRMKMINPIPDRNNRTKNTITNGDNVPHFFQTQYSQIGIANNRL